MSDNDLIKREDVVSLLDTFIAEYGKALIAELGDIEEPMGAEELASIVTDIVAVILAAVKAIHAVPHEMSAVEYDRERRRMCEQYGYCSVSCPLHDFDAGCMTYEPITQEAQNIVEKWAREHPEARSEE